MTAPTINAYRDYREPTPEQAARQAAATAAHAASLSTALASERYVFYETAPEVGLSGGGLIDPTGHTICHFFTFEDGWRERCIELVRLANAALDAGL